MNETMATMHRAAAATTATVTNGWRSATAFDRAPSRRTIERSVLACGASTPSESAIAMRRIIPAGHLEPSVVPALHSGTIAAMGSYYEGREAALADIFGAASVTV